jgi:hypothetical protein
MIVSPSIATLNPRRPFAKAGLAVSIACCVQFDPCRTKTKAAPPPLRSGAPTTIVSAERSML